MRWTALVPLKLGAGGKSRLAVALSEGERRSLALQLAQHVITQLARVPAIEEIVVISRDVLPELPVRHLPDQGRGLNGELDAAAAAIGGNLLVIHADLPLVQAGDIAALLDAAEASGAAIGPDRHGTGTNALALAPIRTGFRYAFGPGSFAAHCALLEGQLAIVERDGLACDIDTPADLAFARAHQNERQLAAT